MARKDPLAQYKTKRNFSVTPEPADAGEPTQGGSVFVIQKHWARRLHYDVRLELDGTMKSWAVPKGPSLDPADKRMAVHVEDHPISYNRFEGQIPAGQYGAGKVIVWDRGTWMPDGDALKGYRAGKLTFALKGEKLQGRWALIRMRGKTEKQDPWLLIKENDEFAKASGDYSVVDALPDSVGPIPPASGASRTAANKTTHRGKRITAAADTTHRPTAPRAALPAVLKPQLATLADTPPGAPEDWLYEIKFDGYRMLARIDARKVRLFTRNGHDWSNRLPHLVKALRSMKWPPGWYDGEIVMMNEHGLPDFQALQNAFDSTQTEQIHFYVFDLPYFKGMDLRGLPLMERRALLAQTLTEAGPVQFSAAFEATWRDIHASACKLGLEGVIAKRKDSPYLSRRSRTWLKLKCGHRQEFVIGGYTEPQGSRAGMGALLLGIHDEHGRLRYAGKVGTGFSSSSLRTLRTRLEALQARHSPFKAGTPSLARTHWVKPTLLAEVSFAQWTSQGRIRHAVFHGLRSDKAASAITREPLMPTDKDTPASQVKVTHPERIVDASTQTRKVDVVSYYAELAALMMPHLKGRPTALLRAPDGIGRQMFFQKHLETSKLAGLRTLPQKLDPEHAPLLEVAGERGLAAAAQMNVLEFHTWNAVKSNIGKPDRMTFDLDPGKGVEWASMQEAALLLRALLLELGLQPFVKTSGGKGLHVVVPLKRRHDWDTVKGLSQAVVQHLAKTFPKRFSAKSGPRNRVGKIFVDYLRNGWGATTVSAWSLRARPGMGVSVPIDWDEVEQITGATQWHIGNIHERLSVGNTPWSDYAGSTATLTLAIKTLKPR